MFLLVSCCQSYFGLENLLNSNWIRKNIRIPVRFNSQLHDHESKEAFKIGRLETLQIAFNHALLVPAVFS